MEIVKVSPSAYVLRDPKSSRNVGCVVTPDGVILVDTGCTAALAAAIQARLPEITDQPIAYVINAHACGEMSIGASHFDAPVIAHHACYQAIEKARASGRAEAAPLPTVSFTEDGYLYIGGLLVELIHAPGKGEGSLAVHLPDEKVLFAGDVLHVDSYPMLPGANAFRWRESLVRMRNLGATQIVAAKGRVAGPEDLDRHIAHLQSSIASADHFRSDDVGLDTLANERGADADSSAHLAKIAHER